MTTLTPHQEAAVSTVVSRIKGLLTPEPLTYVGGYAGTGKSTILPNILESLGYQPETVAFMAPTGKAAKVMRQKLAAQQYPNSNATTIHSGIYRAKPAPISQLESDLAEHEQALEMAIAEARALGEDPKGHPEFTRRALIIKRLRKDLEDAYREDKINFQLNPDSAIQLANLIVVDEASMVGRRMADDLLSFGVPVLAMGDPGQLPPIEDDAGLTGGMPDFFLTEIHRQAADNPIIHLATLAREGKDLPLGDYGNGVEVIKRKSWDPVLDRDTLPKILCGMNKTRWRINLMLREEFGIIDDVRQRLGPQEGEPMIVRKNSRDNPTLVNGTECVATSNGAMIGGNTSFQLSFEDDEGFAYADKRVFQGLFEENYSRKRNEFSADFRSAFRARKNSIEMDFSYAGTVHTAQGSQWDDVVLIDESSVFRDDADKHLYTGVTRAAKTLKVLI